MSKLLVPHVVRAAAGVAALVALAVVPVAAQAGTTDATGTLTSGSLSNTMPAITPFSATLTGTTQTINTNVGAWSVTDARGTSLGYNVTASATAPTVGGVAADAGTGATLALTPKTATKASGNTAGTIGPVATPGAVPLTTVAATIQSAAALTGQGQWDFAADTTAGSLAVVIPGDAKPGTYSSTLTFTTAPLA